MQGEGREVHGLSHGLISDVDPEGQISGTRRVPELGKLADDDKYVGTRLTGHSSWNLGHLRDQQ